MNRRPTNQAFVPVGAALLVVGALGQPAFLGVGAGLLAVGIASRKRQPRRRS